MGLARETICACVCVCMVPLDLSMDGKRDVKVQNHKLYFNMYHYEDGFIVLCHLELLMITEKSQKLTMQFHSQSQVLVPS